MSKEKTGFWDFYALRSSFSHNQWRWPCVNAEKGWVSEWVVTSCQESQNPSSSGNCCFSSGEFSSIKSKQTEVGEAVRSSSKQNKHRKLWHVPEVTSFVTNLSLCGQAWFYSKEHWIRFEDIFRCLKPLVVRTLKIFGSLWMWLVLL